jgi:hypothetical protein
MNNQLIIIPEDVLKKVEILRQIKDTDTGIHAPTMVIQGRRQGWTWAFQILQAEETEQVEQKLIADKAINL